MTDHLTPHKNVVAPFTAAPCEWRDGAVFTQPYQAVLVLVSHSSIVASFDEVVQIFPHNTQLLPLADFCFADFR